VVGHEIAEGVTDATNKAPRLRTLINFMVNEILTEIADKLIDLFNYHIDYGPTPNYMYIFGSFNPKSSST
jgi:hypothetical protein